MDILAGLLIALGVPSGLVLLLHIPPLRRRPPARCRCRYRGMYQTLRRIESPRCPVHGGVHVPPRHGHRSTWLR